jgi:hypothetical protein
VGPTTVEPCRWPPLRRGTEESRDDTPDARGQQSIDNARMRAVSAAAVAWVLALGCGGNRPAGAPDGGNGGGGAGGGGAGGTGITTFDEVFDSNRDLDVLFMVDNSLSMQPLINKLAQNFPTFIQVLQALPTGLPSIHIAVVSSSLGAGAAVFVPNCPVGGDGGEFQYMVGTGTAEPGGAPCPRTGLNDNGQHFISNVAGVANYDETFSVSSAIPPGSPPCSAASPASGTMVAASSTSSRRLRER